MSPAFHAAVHAVDIIREVRARLEAQGGVIELHHLSRFSSAELERLVLLEAIA
jgi:hypothetical protein